MAVSERKSPTVRRFAVGAAATLAMVYATIVGLVYWQQEWLIFHPIPLAPEHRFSVQDVAEVKIPVEGAMLSALRFRLPNPKGVVFFLHGNSGNLDSWLTSVDFYRRNNFDLLVLDYRGFGKSEGHIASEAQLHADVMAAWKSIAADYTGKKVVVYGRSLGSGPAAKLAAEIRPDLTILVTPYLSLDAMATERYPWLPSFINRYPMRSDRWLPMIKSPVLLVHGDNDHVIPMSQAIALRATRAGTDLLVVHSAGHNDIHNFPQYLDGLSRRLAEL